MYNRLAELSNGMAQVRIMEPLRQNGKAVQKTLHSVGGSKSPESVEALKKAAQGMLVFIERLMKKVQNKQIPVKSLISKSG